MLLAETNEKIYLAGEPDEFIVDSFGIETHIGGKHIKFVKTNKTKNNSDEREQWILIDVDSLEKTQIFLADSSEEYITNFHDGQALLQ